MSRLAKNRSVSRAEYVKVAGEIFHGTVDFCTKLSARYQRLLAADTIHLAREVRVNCIKAQETYPRDEVKRQLRERYLLQARASLHALDDALNDIYELLSRNPEGAFQSAGGKFVTGKKAAEKLDSMAQRTGEAISREYELIKAVLSSDRKRG